MTGYCPKHQAPRKNGDPYQRFAGIYDILFERLTKSFRLQGLRMFPPKQGMKVLDVGCGTGIHLKIYKKFGCELYGIDNSPSMLNVALNRLGKNADLRLGDATDMPYESNTFDLILCMFVMHEMNQLTRISVISEMKRVLKIEGRILFIDYHAGPARPRRRWLIKPIILLSELTAGRRHFCNYRHFISTGGLPALIKKAQLAKEHQKVVAGETLALYLVRLK
jgi:ubiquinone/menaquinone biosynthesis C-methylase UbiE